MFPLFSKHQGKIPPNDSVAALNTLELRITNKYDELLQQSNLPAEPPHKHRRLSLDNASRVRGTESFMEDFVALYGVNSKIMLEEVIEILNQVKNVSYFNVYEHGEYVNVGNDVSKTTLKEGAIKCQLGILTRKSPDKLAAEYQYALERITGVLNRYYGDHNQVSIAIADIKANCILTAANLWADLFDDENKFLADLRRSPDVDSYLVTLLCDDPNNVKLERDEQEEYITKMKVANAPHLRTAFHSEFKTRFVYYQA